MRELRTGADDRYVADERFVVIAGDVETIARESDVEVIDRLDVVLLARTTPERSSELSVRPGVIVSVYATESLARIAFDLFRR